MVTPKYGAFEGKPTRFVDNEAWVYAFNAWHQANAAEILVGAHVMTEAEFQNDFGAVPALPKSAFQSGGN